MLDVSTEQVICVKVEKHKETKQFDVYIQGQAQAACMSSCLPKPRAKAVELLGKDIEVLRWPQTRSCSSLTGSKVAAMQQTCRN